MFSASRSAFARAVIICIAFAALPALASCAVDDPEIAAIEARRLLIQDESGGFFPELAVFALFSGGDTADDFSMMTVTHDETGIFWEIPAGSAFLFPGGDGFFWAGSSALLPVPDIFADTSAFADDTAAAFRESSGFFPKGSYSVTADNAAGSSGLSSFELNEPFYFNAQPAVFSLSGEEREARWSIVLSENLSPREVSVYLFLLDSSGSPLSSIRIAFERFSGRRAEGHVSDFAETLSSRRGSESDFSAVRAICCYVEHAASSSGVLLFPLSLEYDGANE